jgi:hypothetical protein
MVRAILDRTKTQTRRILSVQPPADVTSAGVIRSANAQHNGEWHWLTGDPHDADSWGIVGEPFRCPYGEPGDRLWVKETHARPAGGLHMVAYKADGECGAWMGDGDGGLIWNRHGGVVAPGIPQRSASWRGASFGLEKYGGRWRSPRFMPRWASRILLTITDVRVQRLHDITEEDARAEGATPNWWADLDPDGERRRIHSIAYRAGFHELWDTINYKRAMWSSNPWVWAITFERVEVPCVNA